MVSQEVHRLFRYATNSRLRLVHRQLELLHHAPQGGQGLLPRATATDHEIIGVGDQLGVETSLVSQNLPAEDEPSHVEIGEQR